MTVKISRTILYLHDHGLNQDDDDDDDDSYDREDGEDAYGDVLPP